MPMTNEQKEQARLYRKQQYREQKDLLDKMKLEKKTALRIEKEKALWSLIKKADELDAIHNESANDSR